MNMRKLIKICTFILKMKIVNLLKYFFFLIQAVFNFLKKLHINKWSIFLAKKKKDGELSLF